VRTDSAKVAGTGLEPNHANPLNYSAKDTSEGLSRAESVADLKVPPDLQRVITHWKTLPPEVKQTILSLVKLNHKKENPL
jgi:hypothetical protein